MQNYLDQIRNTLSIVDAVGERTKLTKKGREYTGLCPFHGEKTPSFFVNPSKGFYYCFGCGAKGNIFNFYMEAYRMSFIEALQTLAKKAGITLPQKIDIKEDNRAKKLYQLCDIAKNYFINNLRAKENYHAMQYLYRRGFSPSIINEFEIGYASSTNKDIWVELEKNGIYEEDILEIGLKSYNQKQTEYEFFRNRIIFPIKNHLGKTIAFGGRTLGEEQPKYLNTKESIIFHKKDNLYGLNSSLKVLRDSNLIVVEGYFDVIALYQHNFRTAVAGLGTAITSNHLKIIHKYDETPIFCLDGDKAGKKAVNKVIELYMDIIIEGMNPRFIIFDNEDDPDSYLLAHSNEEFSSLIKKAKSISEILWDQCTEGLDLALPEVSALVLGKLMKIISVIKDSRLKSRYISYFKNKVDSYGIKSTPALYVNYSVKKLQVSIDYDTDSTRDAILMACILMYPEMLSEVEEKIGLCSFANSKVETVRQFFVSNISKIVENKEDFLHDIQEECEYILNMNMVKPLLDMINSYEEAKKRFDDTYSLVIKQGLDRQVNLIDITLRELGKQIGKIRSTTKNAETLDNIAELRNIEHRVQILLKQKEEIQKYIKGLHQNI